MSQKRAGKVTGSQRKRRINSKMTMGLKHPGQQERRQPRLQVQPRRRHSSRSSSSTSSSSSSSSQPRRLQSHRPGPSHLGCLCHPLRRTRPRQRPTASPRWLLALLLSSRSSSLCPRHQPLCQPLFLCSQRPHVSSSRSHSRSRSRSSPNPRVPPQTMRGTRLETLRLSAPGLHLRNRQCRPLPLLPCHSLPPTQAPAEQAQSQATARAARAVTEHPRRAGR
jgi:hypothetical protein